MRPDYIIIFVTCPSNKEAQKIVNALLARRLISCGNIIDGVESKFWWQGRIDKAKEVLLLLKTKKANFKKIAKEVKKMHSYEVPEIIAMPIVAGDKGYLQWIEESVTTTR